MMVLLHSRTILNTTTRTPGLSIRTKAQADPQPGPSALSGQTVMMEGVCGRRTAAVQPGNVAGPSEL